MSDDTSADILVRLLVEGIRDYAIFALDPQGRIVSWNEGARRMKGYEASEILGEHFSHFFTPDDIAWGKPQYELKIAAAEGRCEDEGWRLRKDGSRFWANVVISVIIDESGTQRGFSKVTRDLTERRQAEQALRDSEARLRNIVNTAVDGIITIDEVGRIESVNPAVERIFNYAADELIGQNVKLLMPNPYHEAHDQYLRNYVETGDRKIIGIGREVLGRRRNGNIFPVDLAVSEVMLGERRLFTGIIRDITQRKISEQALRDSEARHRAILETAVDGIITIDEHGIIESVNPAAERLFRYSAGELIGRNVSLLMPSPYRDEHDTYLANYLRTGDPKIIGIGREVVGRRKDAVVFPMDLAVSALTIGGRRMFTGLVHDVTDRRRAEEERDRLLQSERLARSEAERASRAKDEFIAVLSHELRTPLTPTLLTLSMIEKRADLPPGLSEDLEVMRRNIELEAKLIDDLLDLARIATGKLVLRREPADVHQLLHNAIEISAQGDDVQLVQELQASEHYVNADPARLQQVFWNLLSNAHKFTPRGGTITVRTSCCAPQRMRVEIADNGRGIEVQMLNKIFNAFEQGHAATARRFGGLGLGLAIAKAIIDAHAGTIVAHSDGEDRGAQFLVELPTVSVVKLPPSTPARGRDHAPPAGLRVLLVEDHVPTLHALARLLRNMGHSVTEATTVQGAVASAEQGHFDLLISDIGLPDGNGCDIMRQLKQRFDIKGIAVSGYGMADDLRRSREAGFAEHLIKPIDVTRLAATVTEVSAAC